MASSPFASVARVAIEEIIREHGSSSKFGLFFSEEAISALAEAMTRFLETSRNLKAAGDRLLSQPPVPKGQVRHTVKAR